MHSGGPREKSPPYLLVVGTSDFRVILIRIVFMESEVFCGFSVKCRFTPRSLPPDGNTVALVSASQPLGFDDSPKHVSSTISFGHSSLDTVLLVFSMERFKKVFITEAQRTRTFYWFLAYSMEDGRPCTVCAACHHGCGHRLSPARSSPCHRLHSLRADLSQWS